MWALGRLGLQCCGILALFIHHATDGDSACRLRPQIAIMIAIIAFSRARSMLGRMLCRRLAPAMMSSVASATVRHAARANMPGHAIHNPTSAAICRIQPVHSTTGRSPVDHLSDELAEANILLQDLIDEVDDCASDEFKEDLAEVTALPIITTR